MRGKKKNPPENISGYEYSDHLIPALEKGTVSRQQGHMDHLIGIPQKVTLILVKVVSVLLEVFFFQLTEF